jgi:hypothetical protein
MALHLTPEEHAADPPSGWTVRKVGRNWHLLARSGGTLDIFPTKREAEAGRSSGRVFNLYEKEGRWMRGEPIPGWRPYAPRPTPADAR